VGQRLNIEIIKNGKTLANAYYHWSAYTSSSLQLTQSIIQKKDDIQHENDIIRAVRLLEITGALLTSDEIEKMNNNVDSFETATSRNDGIIAISESGINTTRRWEEGRVEINLDDETVNFDVFWNYSKESYLGEYRKSEEEYQQMLVKSFDSSSIPFREFDSFASEILGLIDEKIYDVRLENGNVLGFIE
jgi:hypothetical protein